MLDEDNEFDIYDFKKKYMIHIKLFVKVLYIIEGIISNNSFNIITMNYQLSYFAFLIIYYSLLPYFDYFCYKLKFLILIGIDISGGREPELMLFVGLKDGLFTLY